MTRRRNDERGQTFVLTVIFMAMLLGMAALVLDVGSWFREKRQLQSTADAAALAGARPSGATDVGSARSIRTGNVAGSDALASLLPRGRSRAAPRPRLRLQ